MTTHVERSIEVEVPVRTVYDQWTQFEEFPRFMAGVQEVRQVGDAMTHWVAEIAGVRREWDAAILEQVPDQKVAWAATTGATNAGAVYFESVGTDRTRVRLALDYEPEGIVERIGDFFDVVDRQAVADLDRFKEFIEQRGTATGGWRGTVDDTDGSPGAGAAAATATAAGAAALGTVAAGGPGAPDAGSGGRGDDLPGDVVAVGPTGGTHGSVPTEPGPASGRVPDADGPGVGHSGDPVVVDPAATGTAGPTAGAATAGSAGVAGFGTDTGLSSDDPASGVLTGDPGARTASHAGAFVDPGTAGPTADAASSSTGVAGFGTDTGLGSDDPASGAFTGNPRAHARGTGESWTGEPGGRPGTTGATTDPVGESWSADAGDAAAEPARRAGVADADAGDTTSDPVGETWDAQGDVPTTGTRTATTDTGSADDDRARGVTTGMGGARPVAGGVGPAGPRSLDEADAPGPADGIGGALDPLDPRSGTADDPGNPQRPSV